MKNLKALVQDEKSCIKKMAFFSNDFWLRSPVIQKTSQTKTATAIVTCASSKQRKRETPPGFH